MRDALPTAAQVAALVITGLMVVCRLLPGAAAPGTSLAGDLDVKAAFVLNFIRLVNWSNVPEEQNYGELPVPARRTLASHRARKPPGSHASQPGR